MTQEQIIDKYKDVTFVFNWYYKYTFYYYGTAEDGSVIIAAVGGDPDEIYRAELSKEETLESLIGEVYLLDLRIKEDN